MVKVRENLIGKTFGRLKVIKQAEDYINKKGTYLAQWRCKCDCGNEVTILSSNLKSGKVKSCGCYAKEIKHKIRKKYNQYNLNGEYGIGYSSNTNKEFYFDLEDYDKIKDYCWYEDDNGYIINKSYGKHLYLHSLISGYQYTDHINRNKKDNRKENLRPSSNETNSMNREILNKNKSGIIGIIFDKNRGLWACRIGYKRKTINLKRSEKIEELIPLRLQAEYDLFGPEWAPQRHLFEQYNIPDSKLHQYLLDKGKLDCLDK